MRTRIVERTTKVNGAIAQLHGAWGTRSKEDAIKDIETGRYGYRVKDGRWLEIVNAQPRYLRSIRDDLKLNNLQSLPQEPRVVIHEPFYAQHFRENSPIHFEAEARDASGNLEDDVLWKWDGKTARGKEFDRTLPVGVHTIWARIQHGKLSATDHVKVYVDP